MDPKKIKQNKILRKDDIIYLIIMLIFFLIVVIIFFYSTNFEIKNINKIFTQNNETNIRTLDRDQYLIVEKRFNLPKN